MQPDQPSPVSEIMSTRGSASTSSFSQPPFKIVSGQRSSLDSLLDTLREFKHSLETNTVSSNQAGILARAIETKRKGVDERQKEAFNTLSRFGRNLDKVGCLSISP